jgi:alpha-1,2-mannosyltransferase
MESKLSSFSTITSIILLVRLLSALYNFNFLSDCDEVMNYWEPTHFLQFGNGLQTWEYRYETKKKKGQILISFVFLFSPEYGIRSYSYILIHTIIASFVAFFNNNKVKKNLQEIHNQKAAL